jgi:hypothetical protein
MAEANTNFPPLTTGNKTRPIGIAQVTWETFITKLQAEFAKLA